MNKKFYFIASLLFASTQMGLAQNSIVKRVDVKDIPTIKAPAQAFTQVTKLTGWTYTNSSGETENVSVQYDDKGRFLTIDHGTYKELISYTDGTNGQWIEMTITKSEGSTLIHQYKNVRTQDAEGRIVTEKVYENTDGEHLSLPHSYAYAYSVVDNAERISLIEDMKYDEFNPEGTGTKYVWCEPTKSYIENRYNAHERTITTLKDGTYSTIHQELDEDKGTWTTWVTEDIRYDNKGEQCYYQRKSYARDGRLMEAEGRKTETAYNTPTAGYHTIISYTFTNGNDEDSSTDSQPNLADYQWVPNQKKEVSDNYDQEQMVYGEKKSCKIYSYDNGNWILSTDEVMEWVNKHVLKKFYNSHNYKDDAGYFYYDDNGKELGNAYMFNDGSYLSAIYMDYKINGRDVNEYTLYDKQHNMLKKYRETFIDKENYLNTTEPFLLQEWDGTAWRNFVGTFKLGEGACSAKGIFDEKGRIIDSYVYDEKGDIKYHTTTTYQNNGYTETEYEWSEDHSALYANWETTCSIDENGTYQTIQFEYDLNHNIIYGRKDKEYTNGVSETYSWNGSGWTLRNSGVSSLTSTNGNETINISREWQDGKIVETRKRIEVHTDDYTKYEEYVKQDGKWVGKSKQESRIVNYHTDFATTPADPLQDYYNKTNTIDAGEALAEAKENDHTWFQWDAATGDWKIESSRETSIQIVGNTLTQTIKNIVDGGRYINTQQTIYKRDAQMRLTSVEETETETDTDSSDSNHAATLYTYDNEGNLISKQFTGTDGSTGKYIYQYGKIDVVNGIESGIDDARGSIIVTDRNIHVAGAQGLALYSLSGTLVSQSTSDVIEAPTSGLYILTAKNKKTKIFVK
nr:hypothetical protein [Prevotella sp.]